MEPISYYLQQLQRNGIPESYFREVQKINTNSFRFQLEKEPYKNAEDLVNYMKLYPPVHILNGSVLYFEYNAEIIQKLLNEFGIDKENIIITSKKLINTDLKFDLTEKWYGTKYCLTDRPAHWKTLWNAPRSFENEIYLPKPNDFITTDFTILSNDEILTADDGSDKYPKKIFENDKSELWFKQDFKFKLPLGNYYFHLI